MTPKNKMSCPECGVEMNHHATKIDYTTDADGFEEIDPVFGGVLEEAHSCPQCGRTEMRRA